MTPFSELKLEAEGMQQFLSEQFSTDLESLAERGNVTALYYARAGEMLVEAKYHYNCAIQKEVMKFIKEVLTEARLSSKVQNSFIESVCKEESYLVDKIERITKSCYQHLEWIKTLIIKAQSEMKYLNN